MLTYLVISTVPPLRALFALSPLEPRYIPPIVAALAVWLFLVRLVWRGQFLERFLGLGDG
jgi:hypothetical protein